MAHPDREQPLTPEIKRWQEAFPVERLDTRVQFEFEELLKNRVAIFEGYSKIDGFWFNYGLTKDTATPRDELTHLINNSIMRGNLLDGITIFDLSKYPSFADPEQRKKLSQKDLLDLYFQSTAAIFNPLTATDQEDNPQDNIEKPVSWFGRNLTGRQLLILGYGHEARHAGIMVRELDYRGMQRTHQDIENWGR